MKTNITIFSILTFIILSSILILRFKNRSESISQVSQYIQISENFSSKKCASSSFVYVKSGDFYCKNNTDQEIPFKFVGVNIRPLAFIDKQLLPNNTYDDFEFEVREQVISASEMNATVIRIYAPYFDATAQESVARIESILDIAETIDPSIKFYISLTDFNKASNFWVQGDDLYYTRGNNEYLNEIWFEDGYKENYKPFVSAVAGSDELRDDPRIFAWQLFNEGQTADGLDMYAFFDDMASHIKNPISEGGLGVTQMLSPGFKNISHGMFYDVSQVPQAQVLNSVYTSGNFDFASLHIYGEDIFSLEFINELNWYKFNNYPFVVGEYGIHNNSTNRKQELFDYMSTLFTVYETQGVMQWGYYAGEFSMGSDFTYGLIYFEMDEWVTQSDLSPEIVGWGGIYSSYRCIADQLQKGTSTFEECSPSILTSRFSTFTYKDEIRSQSEVNIQKSYDFDWDDVTHSNNDEFTYTLYLWNEEPYGTEKSFLKFENLHESNVNLRNTDLLIEQNVYGMQVYLHDDEGYVAHGPILIFELQRDCGPVDVDQDGLFALKDLASLVWNYKKHCYETKDYKDSTCGPADSNQDGEIRLTDLSFHLWNFRKDCTI